MWYYIFKSKYFNNVFFALGNREFTTFLPSCLLILVVAPAVLSDLKCELDWKPSGFGNYPELAIQVQNQILARVFVDSKWLLGSLDPDQGKTFVINNGKINTYATYQTLTNPRNCTLKWVRSCNGVIPMNAYAVNELDPAVTIGKSVISGWEEIGGIQAGEIQFLYKQQPSSDLCYNALVSIYPRLTAKFSEFSFDLDHVLIRDHSYVELVGRQGLRHTVNDVQVSTTIRHSRMFRERYILEEDSEFSKIGEFELDMDLWFGESGIQDERQSLGENQKGITVTRNREIVVSRDIMLNEQTDLQICSTMEILNGFAINYTAIGRFSLPGMRIDQVLEVLKATDRTLLLESDESSAIVRINGTLSGKYVIATSSVTGAIDKAGLCTSIISRNTVQESI